MCSYCPRVICGRCIVWPPDTPKDAPFRCIHCYSHDPQTGMRKGPSPYLVRLFIRFRRGTLIILVLQGLKTSSTPLVLKGPMTTRRSFPPLDTSPLMIISFRLEDLPEAGNPPIASYHDMLRWFPADHIRLIDMSFNFDTKASRDRFDRKMDRFVKRFKTDFNQFVIFEYFTILLKLIVLEAIRDSLYTSRPTASLMRGGFTVKERTNRLSPLKMYVYV